MIRAMRKLRRDRRGFGHFIALGMGVAAAMVMFGIIWPSAKTMMGSTVTSMTSLNAQMEGSLSGITVTASGTTVTAQLPAGVTPATTASEWSVTAGGSANAVSNVSVSGDTATLTVSASTTGKTVTVTYTDGSSVYTGTSV